MALGIEDFKTQFNGGARKNLYRVHMTNIPSFGDKAQKQLEFLVKATSLPASTVEVLNVPFRGRDFKIAGKRSFEEWQITVINDTDFALREMFEIWSARMSAHDVNSSAYSGKGTSGFAGYQVDANVFQLKHGACDHTDDYGYKFVGMWPSTIGAIDLAMEGEEIQEYQVTFQYQYWYSGRGNAPTTGQCDT